MNQSQLALVVAGGAAACLALWHCCSHVRLDRFPQVPGLPLLGVLLKLGPSDDLLVTVEQWSRQYGKDGVFEFQVGPQRIVTITDLQLCREILALRPTRVTRPAVYGQLGIGDLQHGVFFMEGRGWSTQRRLMSPGFNTRSLETYMPAVHGILQELVAQVAHAASANRSLEVGSLFRRFTADVISKVAFGHEFGALQSDSAELQDVMALMDALMLRATSPVHYWKVPLLARLLDSGDRAVERLQQRTRKLLESHTVSTGPAQHLMDKLMQAEGEKLTTSELVGNLITLFVAGTDTTSHTLSWAFYELARHKDLQRVLAEEALRFPSGVPQLDDVKLLPNTNAFWLETLRVHSVAPFNDAQNTEPLVIKGKKVPPKTTIWLLTREALLQSKEAADVLGSDLHLFRPSRWLNANGQVAELPQFETWTFGHGARICLGKSLANLEGVLAIAELLRHFQVESWEGPELKERTSFVQMPGGPVELRFTHRNA